MSTIKLHTYPDGQQLSDGELIQIQVTVSGSLVFKDAYFHELQDGDVYYIPEQVELPLATDADILDFIIDNRQTISWGKYHSLDGNMQIYFYDRSTQKDIYEGTTTSRNPTEADVRGLFREVASHVIANTSL